MRAAKKRGVAVIRPAGDRDRAKEGPLDALNTTFGFREASAGRRRGRCCAKKAVGRICTIPTSGRPSISMLALEAPIRQISENAGVEGSIVVGKILENKSETFGFDAQTEQYVDMVEKGIIDPAKVVRTALQDASSVAGLLVTTEAMVAELPKEPAAPMPGGGGGMGGMGGMGF